MKDPSNESKNKLISGFQSYSSKINWFVFVLICIFSWGGWIEVFAIWSELPLMVNSLPEGWRLPGILNGIVQMGQIGSLIYLVGKKYFPKIFTLRKMICIKLISSTIFTFILSYIWDRTFFVLGEERSMALFLIIFIFSLCDGSSTLCVVPYISESFKKEYIIPYYIGETLFAVIPSVLAIIQGVGDDLGCRNVTVPGTVQILPEAINMPPQAFKIPPEARNTTPLLTDLIFNISQTYVLEPIPLNPKFPVSVYFHIIFVFLCFSSVAFFLINYLGRVQEHKQNKNEINKPTSDSSNNTLLDKPEVKVILNNTCNYKEKITLFTINFFITFFFYGVLPGIQSYSTLPYGNLFLPISIFLSVWSYNVSVKRIIFEFLIALTFTTYLIVISTMSPCPPLLGNPIGSILTVVCWICSQSIFMRVRCIISTRLERFGENTLLASGSFTILGEIFGGIFTYILVEYFRIFTEAPECVFDFSFCTNI